MIFIDRTETNPYFNIAAEEYVLRNFKEDVLMLWESKNSVILGKHQNAFAEINYPYLINNRIPLIRRISGGGTVFHGKGNLNLTVIRTSNGKNGLVNFREFTEPLINFLLGLGVEAQFEGKNNLRLEGLKFSGNSAHIFKNRVMHHGTILFDANLNQIDEIINLKSNSFHDKAVKSIRANVTNLKHYLPTGTTYLIFKQFLKEYLFKHYNIKEVRSFTKLNKNEILRLMQERYKSWNWNFGYSPAFEFNNKISVSENEIKCLLKIKNAIVLEAEINKLGVRIDLIEKAILSKKYSQVSIRTVLLDAGLSSEEITVYLKLFGLA